LIIVGTYTSSPITAEPYRAKGLSLHVRRSCFAPTDARPRDLELRARGGGAGYRPRVRAAYYTAVYRHSRLPDIPNIMRESKELKVTTGIRLNCESSETAGNAPIS
jgi:hypothetical protein